jgi:hypothetical protein
MSFFMHCFSSHILGVIILEIEPPAYCVLLLAFNVLGRRREAIAKAMTHR